MSNPKTQPLSPAMDPPYPSCETTLWQIGQWRCAYWRPAGQWRASSIRLFKNDRLVRTAAFGLGASEQSSAWRTAMQAKPEHDPR